MGALSFLLSGCAEPVKLVDTEVKTHTSGATVYIDDMEFPEITPFFYQFDFKKQKEYKLIATKEGFFQKEFIVSDQLASLDEREVRIKLDQSPLWKATTTPESISNVTWLPLLPLTLTVVSLINRSTRS